MKQMNARLMQALQISFLKWNFRKASVARVATAPDEGNGRYEDVEEICLRRGQRSYRVVRKLIEGACRFGPPSHSECSFSRSEGGGTGAA